MKTVKEDKEMKKVLLALMTLMILTMQPLINANATTDDVNDTTQIEEEKTPEAGRQKKQTKISHYLRFSR